MAGKIRLITSAGAGLTALERDAFLKTLLFETLRKTCPQVTLCFCAAHSHVELLLAAHIKASVIIAFSTSTLFRALLPLFQHDLFCGTTMETRVVKY